MKTKEEYFNFLKRFKLPTILLNAEFVFYQEGTDTKKTFIETGRITGAQFFVQKDNALLITLTTDCIPWKKGVITCLNGQSLIGDPIWNMEYGISLY